MFKLLLKIAVGYLLIFFACNKYAANLQSEKQDSLPLSTEVDELEKEIRTSFFRQIPGENNNWRSPEPSQDDLCKFVEKHKIRLIIRLNSENEKGSKLSFIDEIACQVPIEYINLHKYSYVKGQGHLEALEKIHQELLQGSVLVHCLHGFDRTGAGVAYHLKKLDYSKGFIVRHNDWESYLEKKGPRYSVYYDAVNN